MFRFFDYSLDSENRCKFFLEIWCKGAFQSDLFTSMPLIKRESIEEFEQVELIKGLVTVTNRENPATRQVENFFLISEKNLSNLFFQICKYAEMKFTVYKDKILEIQQELLQLHEKNNFEIPVLEDIPNSLGNSDYDKIHSTLLKKDNIYLLLWLLKTCPTINRNEKLNKFFASAIIKIIRINSLSLHVSVNL